MEKAVNLILFCVISNFLLTCNLNARELNFDEPQLYYEILFDVGVSLSTTFMEKKFASGKGRDTFPTQGLDDQVSIWFHGEDHTPFATPNERKLDDLSGRINNSLMLGAFLSPILKKKGHRLGALMTLIHSQEIWFFMNRSLKVLVDRQRPKFHYTKNPSAADTSSFPSGHTGQAFVMVFADDFLFDMPLWAEVSAYSLATAAAFLRISADRHFFTDVAVGSGIAYLGAWMAHSYFEESNGEKESDIDTLSFRVLPDRVDVTYQF